MAANPLFSDKDIEFLLYEVLQIDSLARLPYFSEHSKETFDLYLESTRRLARDVLFPLYKPMDEFAAAFREDAVAVHPKMKETYRKLADLGVISATRPAEVGGQQLPMTIAAVAHAYLMAANLSAYGYAGLTSGAAHLLEVYGDEFVRETFMQPLYDGAWTGTMALTEPQAGSSLGDLTTKAVPDADGRYRISGNKIFISGGDHDAAPNVVNMTLARIEGAPPGVKGISLFAVPKLRSENGALVPNDVSTAGLIHKIGWRGLPSAVLNYGENGDCFGWLVGEPHKGLYYMFQMMNEARIMVGMNGVSTAAVAYHESLDYARTRTQGRPVTGKDPGAPQVPIIEHADVRRMLLRQKCIVEGGLSLLATTSRYADLAEHAEEAEEKENAKLLLDLLTPVAKSFPAEWGYESNALAVQIFGGYGYSDEYLPEAWLRDQKLNSIHEGTTGIQSMDLLGRKVVAQGGKALELFRAEVVESLEEAKGAGLPIEWRNKMEHALSELQNTTMHLGALGMQGDVDGMLRHSFHYLQLFSIVAVGWQWLRQATRASAVRESPAFGPDFAEGKLRACQYWIATEVSRVSQLGELCRSGDDSYAAMKDAGF